MERFYCPKQAAPHTPLQIIWVWVKMKPPVDLRSWSLLPITRASHFGNLLLTQSHFSRVLLLEITVRPTTFIIPSCWTQKLSIQVFRLGFGGLASQAQSRTFPYQVVDPAPPPPQCGMSWLVLDLHHLPEAPRIEVAVGFIGFR